MMKVNRRLFRLGQIGRVLVSLQRVERILRKSLVDRYAIINFDQITHRSYVPIIWHILEHRGYSVTLANNGIHVSFQHPKEVKPLQFIKNFPTAKELETLADEKSEESWHRLMHFLDFKREFETVTLERKEYPCLQGDKFFGELKKLGVVTFVDHKIVKFKGRRTEEEKILDEIDTDDETYGSYSDDDDDYSSSLSMSDQ